MTYSRKIQKKKMHQRCCFFFVKIILMFIKRIFLLFGKKLFKRKEKNSAKKSIRFHDLSILVVCKTETRLNHTKFKYKISINNRTCFNYKIRNTNGFLFVNSWLRIFEVNCYDTSVNDLRYIFANSKSENFPNRNELERHKI